MPPLEGVTSKAGLPLPHPRVLPGTVGPTPRKFREHGPFPQATQTASGDPGSFPGAFPPPPPGGPPPLSPPLAPMPLQAKAASSKHVIDLWFRAQGPPCPLPPADTVAPPHAGPPPIVPPAVPLFWPPPGAPPPSHQAGEAAAIQSAIERGAAILEGGYSSVTVVHPSPPSGPGIISGGGGRGPQLEIWTPLETLPPANPAPAASVAAATIGVGTCVPGSSCTPGPAVTPPWRAQPKPAAADAGATAEEEPEQAQQTAGSANAALRAQLGIHRKNNVIPKASHRGGENRPPIQDATFYNNSYAVFFFTSEASAPLTCSRKQSS